MSQCQCEGIESVFDEKLAGSQLARSRKRGAPRSTRLLIDELLRRGVNGRTLLDIGGGIGAIQHELLAAGVTEATDVDASSAYLKAARAEAERRGFDSRIRFHHGNFVDLAHDIPPADIVTLDRVICCYDNAQALLSASVEKARSYYGLVYPREVWWTRLGVRLMNFSRRLRRDPFRVFAHPAGLVDSILSARGFQRAFRRVTGMWQVVLFSREPA
jgi:SAM-dependent methyltransferase